MGLESVYEVWWMPLPLLRRQRIRRIGEEEKIGGFVNLYYFFFFLIPSEAHFKRERESGRRGKMLCLYTILYNFITINTK